MLKKKSVRVSEPIFLSSVDFHYRMTYTITNNYECEFPRLGIINEKKNINKTGYTLKRRK